jgi:hypothetical protein
MEHDSRFRVALGVAIACDVRAFVPHLAGRIWKGLDKLPGKNSTGKSGSDDEKGGHGLLFLAE